MDARIPGEKETDSRIAEFLDARIPLYREEKHSIISIKGDLFIFSLSLSRSLSIYIYIYIERERERNKSRSLFFIRKDGSPDPRIPGEKHSGSSLERGETLFPSYRKGVSLLSIHERGHFVLCIEKRTVARIPVCPFLRALKNKMK